MKFSSKDRVGYIKLKEPSQYTEEDAMFVFCSNTLSEYNKNFVSYFFGWMEFELRDERGILLRKLGEDRYRKCFENAVKTVLTLKANEFAKGLCSSDSTVYTCVNISVGYFISTVYNILYENIDILTSSKNVFTRKKDFLKIHNDLKQYFSKVFIEEYPDGDKTKALDCMKSVDFY